MREWNDGDIVKVLDEGESLTEPAVINQIAKAADRWSQLVFLELATENAL